MDNYEELKRKKLEEYKKRLQEQLEAQQEEQARQAQIDEILNTILTPDAKSRLANIRLANPKKADKVISVLVYLYQSGRLAKKINDEELKKILIKISETSRKDTNIKIIHK